MKQVRLLTVLAACLFAVAAFAQQNPPAKGDDHKHMDHDMGSVDDHVKDISAKLNLTADQEAKVKAILVENHQKMESTMNDTSLSKDDKHAKMQSIHDSVHTQVREILTDEQKPKFDAMVKDMEDHMHSHNGADKDHHK